MRAGVTLSDVGLVELNEAFAAQALAVLHEWGMDPAEWVTETADVPPDRAFVVNVLLDYAEANEDEGEAEVSAVYGYFSDEDRLEFAYGADYPLIEPDDEEFDETEEQWS